MTRIGLTLYDAKTGIKQAHAERFDCCHKTTRCRRGQKLEATYGFAARGEGLAVASNSSIADLNVS
jgi:hypothetical protein